MNRRDQRQPYGLNAPPPQTKKLFYFENLHYNHNDPVYPSKYFLRYQQGLSPTNDSLNMSFSKNMLNPEMATLNNYQNGQFVNKQNFQDRRGGSLALENSEQFYEGNNGQYQSLNASQVMANSNKNNITLEDQGIQIQDQNQLRQYKTLGQSPSSLSIQQANAPIQISNNSLQQTQRQLNLGRVKIDQINEQNNNNLQANYQQKNLVLNSDNRSPPAEYYSQSLENSAERQRNNYLSQQTFQPYNNPIELNNLSQNNINLQNSYYNSNNKPPQADEVRMSFDKTVQQSPGYANKIAQTKLNQSVDYGQLTKNSIISGTGLVNEQEKYYLRLKNSMQRQGHLYQKHVQNAYVPEKLRISTKFKESLIEPQMNVVREMINQPPIQNDFNSRQRENLNKSYEVPPYNNSRYKINKSSLLTGAGNSIFLRDVSAKQTFNKGAGINSLFQ